MNGKRRFVTEHWDMAARFALGDTRSVKSLSALYSRHWSSNYIHPKIRILIHSRLLP